MVGRAEEEARCGCGVDGRAADGTSTAIGRVGEEVATGGKGGGREVWGGEARERLGGDEATPKTASSAV